MLLRAQSPLSARFVQQRGLLYIPVDVMVGGGILQQEATKLGLGKVEATATALSGPGPVLDALLSGAVDYGTAALPSLLTVWERTRGSANEVKAVGAVSNGAMTLYTINPNVKTLADFGEQDRIAVPTVRLSFNAMMLQMAAEQLWGDPHRLDHLTVALGHPDAVTALSAVTAHIGVQPFTDRGLKLAGAHIITDSRKVFGGPLTQITLLATRQTRRRTPPCSRLANALEEAIRVANADKRQAAALWKEVQKAPESVDDLVAQLDDPGFEFTSRSQRIAHFTAFLIASVLSRPRLATGRSCSGKRPITNRGIDRACSQRRAPTGPTRCRRPPSLPIPRCGGTGRPRASLVLWSAGFARREAVMARAARRALHSALLLGSVLLGALLLTVLAPMAQTRAAEEGQASAVPVRLESVLGRDVATAPDGDAGRIIDLLVDRDGNVRAAVVEFGGFLGIGTRKIAIEWPAFRFSGRVIAVDVSRDQIRAAPDYKTSDYNSLVKATSD